MWTTRARICALALLVWFGHAQAESLSLAQAAQEALRQNPRIGQGLARIMQAESGLAQADGVGMPQINLSLNATRSNDALSAFGLKLGQRRVDPASDFGQDALNHPEAINNLNTRVELQAPVYTGGQTAARKDEARAHLRAARDGDEAARQQILLETLQAWQGVHLARAYRKVAEQGLHAATEYARITESLHKQGMAVKSDRLTVRVNLEDARLRVAESKRHEANALDRLKRVLGRPLGESIDVAAETGVTLPPGSEDDLRALAINQHPALRAQRAQIDAAAAGVLAARGALRPQGSLLMRQEWNDQRLGLDASSYTLAGMLSWNAFDGGVSRAVLDRAQALRQEQAARLREVEDGIALQVTEARRRALEAETRLAVRQAALEDAEEAQRLTQVRYQNGVTTLVDLFSAQAQLDKARAELAQARFDLVIARGEVLQAAGLLTPEQF